MTEKIKRSEFYRYDLLVYVILYFTPNGEDVYCNPMLPLDSYVDQNIRLVFKARRFHDKGHVPK